MNFVDILLKIAEVIEGPDRVLKFLKDDADEILAEVGNRHFAAAMQHWNAMQKSNDARIQITMIIGSLQEAYELYVSKRERPNFLYQLFVSAMWPMVPGPSPAEQWYDACYRSLQCLVLISACYRYLGQVENALDYINKAIELFPIYFEAGSSYAYEARYYKEKPKLTLARQRRWESAMEEEKSAILLIKDNLKKLS